MLSSLIRERVLGDKWVSQKWNYYWTFSPFSLGITWIILILIISLSCFSSVAFCIPQNVNLLVGAVWMVACVVLCYGQGILYEFPESPNPNLTLESIWVVEPLPLSGRSWRVWAVTESRFWPSPHSSVSTLLKMLSWSKCMCRQLHNLPLWVINCTSEAKW